MSNDPTAHKFVSLWRVAVFVHRSHTNPAWVTQVMAPSQQAALICAMTRHEGFIGRVEVEAFDGYGAPSSDWT